MTEELGRGDLTAHEVNSMTLCITVFVFFIFHIYFCESKVPGLPSYAYIFNS